MARQLRKERDSIILYGEGETEALILDHIKNLYSKELKEKKVIVDHGGGGSSRSVLENLVKKHIAFGHVKTPCLVLIDKDKGLDPKAKKILKGNKNIKLAMSSPECLEGMLLDLLDDLPQASDCTSKKLKKYFQKEYLGSELKVQVNLKKQRTQLFSKQLLVSKRGSIAAIDTILSFLEV